MTSAYEPDFEHQIRSATKPVRIDTRTGMVSVTDAQPADGDVQNCITVTFSGDWAPPVNGAGGLSAPPAAAYNALRTLLQGSDLNVVNVEGVFTGGATQAITKDGPSLAIDSQMLHRLTTAPFHVACLANNHTFDFGSAGMTHTRMLLEAEGIACIGAGLSLSEAIEPYTCTIKGFRLAILNFAEGEEAISCGAAGVAPLDSYIAVKTVERVARDADIVIVVCHAGREYASVPPPYVQLLYRRIVAAGATAVIGHHPHVIQGLEVYQGAPILYSLGNFDFCGESAAEKTGMLAMLQFDRGAATQVALHPFCSDANGIAVPGTDWRQGIFNEIQQLSEVAACPAMVRAQWAAAAQQWLRAGGFEEYLQAAIAVSSRRQLLRAVLVARAHEQHGDSFFARAARILLWKAIGYLGRTPDLSAVQAVPVRSGLVAKPAAILANRFATDAHRQYVTTAFAQTGSHVDGPCADAS